MHKKKAFRRGDSCDRLKVKAKEEMEDVITAEEGWSSVLKGDQGQVTHI